MDRILRMGKCAGRCWDCIPAYQLLLNKNMEQTKPTILDKLVRATYGIAGVLSIGVAIWFLFFVSPFNPYGFWGFVIAGLVLLIAGAGAKAKDILFFPFP